MTLALLDHPAVDDVVSRLQAITPEQAADALLATRATLAFGSLVAPRLTGALFGISSRENPSTPYLARLFGAREGWLVAEVLLAESDAERARLFEQHMWIDVADLVAAVLAGKTAVLKKRAAVLAGLTAAAAAALGYLAATLDD